MEMTRSQYRPRRELTTAALGFVVLIGEGIKLVNQPLGMDPAKAVFTDVKLARVIADDDGVGE